MKKVLFFCFTLVIGHLAYADNTAITAAYFNNIKNDDQELQIFLSKMPKGGDIHVHIDGVVYAENLIKYAGAENFCLDPKTFAAYKNTNCQNKYKLSNLHNEPVLYQEVIDAWSMRNFPIGDEQGEKQFFKVFPRVESMIAPNIAKIVAGAANRAAMENEDYLEIMIGSDTLGVYNNHHQTPIQISKGIPWQGGFAHMRKVLLNAGIDQVIQNLKGPVENLPKRVAKALQCGTKNAEPGCRVAVGYQYYTRRSLPKSQVFAQFLVAFAAAHRYPKIIEGINLVMPENWYYSLHDYTKQMEMVGYLHKLYPKVHISLHAGELAPGLVRYKDLRFHVRQAINIAHADRIGHGLDIAYENNAVGLLNEMARKHKLVEINLTSNKDVPDVSGHSHPITLYEQYHVPIALSTDDEGIERTDLTQQYKIAAEKYKLTYPELKSSARDSLTYSFLPGKSLWLNANKHIPVKACQDDILGSKNINASCTAFLKRSKKARLQWRLEEQFKHFERQYA